MGFLRRRKDNEPVDLEGRSPRTGIKYKDLAVIQQLVRVGADISEPRHALYFLYFDGPVPAEAAAEDARRRGFATEVRDPLPDFQDRWSLIRELLGVVLNPEVVRGNTDFFEHLAQTHSGEFDGWEASVS